MTPLLSSSSPLRFINEQFFLFSSHKNVLKIANDSVAPCFPFPKCVDMTTRGDVFDKDDMRRTFERGLVVLVLVLVVEAQVPVRLLDDCRVLPPFPNGWALAEKLASVSFPFISSELINSRANALYHIPPKSTRLRLGMVCIPNYYSCQHN